MKKYLMAFNVILFFLSSSHIYADNASLKHFYPDYNIVNNENTIRLVFIKNNDSSSFEKAKVYAVNKNNEEEYITKIVDDKVVSVFQGDGIANGKSVYLITRSKIRDNIKNGYYYNTTELPIIESNEGIHVRFFKGDPLEPALQNCFDGVENSNNKVIKCNYKTQDAVNQYIAAIHSKVEHSDITATFADEFPKYCRDLNEGKIFEGSLEYICVYDNKTLLETYLRIKPLINDNHVLMEKIEPMKNFSYTKEGDKISYQWKDNHTLKMILNMNDGAEIRTYLFNESGKKTTLKINVDTAY